MKACMGGWCLMRELCPHYAVSGDPEPADRLCIQGEDGRGADFPIRVIRAAGTWERKSGIGLLARAVPFDALGQT